MPRTIHIIGAGLAGLSAAVELTARGHAVLVHEATTVAGGRCRSYYDNSVGMTIDNGNHLLLSGNRAAPTTGAQPTDSRARACRARAGADRESTTGCAHH